MPTVAEQMAELDQRIAYLETTTEDLAMTQLDKTSHQQSRTTKATRCSAYVNHLCTKALELARSSHIQQ